MLQSFLLEAPAGSSLILGSSNGILALLQRALLVQPALSRACTTTLLPVGPCHTVSEIWERQYSSSFPAAEAGSASGGSGPPRQACGRITPSSSNGHDGLWSRGGLPPRVLSGLCHPLAFPLRHQLLRHQHRDLSTSSGAYADFASNLTRPAKAKVLNRDNFQRWRDSGRDARVAQDIVDEAQGPGGGRGSGGGGGGGGRGSGGGPRRGGRGGGGGGGPRTSHPLDELRALLLECRDLRELQVVVRECGRDMGAQLVCIALSRLPKLKQATPAAASPSTLARRVGESLMLRLQDVLGTAHLSGLSAALQGLADVAVLPGRPLLEAVADRLAAPSPRGGNTAIVEADPRVVASLLLSTAKFRGLQGAATWTAPRGVSPGSNRGSAAPAGAAAASHAAGAGATEGEESGGEAQQGAGNPGSNPVRDEDVLRDRLWPLVRYAAEGKLLRALGEEPEGVAAAPVGGEEGSEVDDSMPQSALRITCLALALTHDTHPGTWTAATRLATRHAQQLQPAVAAAVLRSYAVAGGPLLDDGGGEGGGREGGGGLLPAVWGRLRDRVRQLDVPVLLDLTFAAAKLAVAPAPAPAPEAAAGVPSSSSSSSIAAEMLPRLCAALTPRVPSMSCADVSLLATGLAEVHRRRTSTTTTTDFFPRRPQQQQQEESSSSPSQRHAYGDLPQLLGDLLLLRGPAGFGASNFASVALALALLGHGDRAFWRAVEGAALPEAPRMDGKALSKLLGALHSAGMAAAGAAAAAADAAAVATAVAGPIPTAIAVRPSEALLEAVYARTAALLGGAEGGSGAAAPPADTWVTGSGSGIGGKEAFHILRCLAEWPLPGGGADTLRRLADTLVEVEGAEATGRGPVAAAPPPVRQRLAAVLRGAGLDGEHALMELLGPATSFP